MPQGRHDWIKIGACALCLASASTYGGNGGTKANLRDSLVIQAVAECAYADRSYNPAGKEPMYVRVSHLAGYPINDKDPGIPGDSLADFAARQKNSIAGFTFTGVKSPHLVFLDRKHGAPKVGLFTNAGLPGYSKSGKSAFVRSEHGLYAGRHRVVGEFWLELHGHMWKVRWHKITVIL